MQSHPLYPHLVCGVFFVICESSLLDKVNRTASPRKGQKDKIVSRRINHFHSGPR